MTKPARDDGIERMTPQTLAVLDKLVSRPTADWYGFDLAVQAGIKTGSVYPVLARLERHGWLTSWWEDIDQHREGGPRKRFYRLTAEGAVAATRAVESVAARKHRRRAFGRLPTPSGQTS